MVLGRMVGFTGQGLCRGVSDPFRATDFHDQHLEEYSLIASGWQRTVRME